MNSIYDISRFRIFAMSIFAFAVLSVSLIIPLSSYAQLPDSQDSSVVTIPQKDWYYRWGDSPVDDKGVPLWTYQDESSPEWKLMGKGQGFKSDQHGEHFLWLMIPFPAGNWRNPALAVSPTYQNVAVYHGQNLVYRSGEFRPSGSNRFLAYSWHRVPLKSGGQRGMIFLRIYSDNVQAVGTMSYPIIWVGHETGLTREFIKRDIDHAGLGFLFVLVGLFSISIYLRRKERLHIILSFGITVTLIGIGQLTIGPVIQLFVGSIPLLYYLYFTTFFLFPIALYVFVEQVLGRGYKSLIRRVWQVHIPVAAAALLLDVTNVFPVFGSMFFLFILLIIGIFISLPIATISAYRGNSEAKMLQAGMIIFMMSGMHDMLMTFGVIPFWRFLFPWGVFALIVAVAYILEHRFSQARRDLEEYNRTLELKVEDRTQELSKKNSALEQAFQKLRDTQTQLVMQSKMASLGDLVAGVAHEMNNPIGVIHSAADTATRGMRRIVDLLQDSEAQTQQPIQLVQKNHQIITVASDRIAKTVQNLRTFAALDEALFQQVDIHENIDTTLSLLYHELKDGANVVKEYGHIPRIQCYPNEINQAFMNLFKNAIQATEQQGTITLVTYADETQVYVKISDTGEGISPEGLPRVFDPGFTTRGGGVGKGLGLSIVYNIVQKHHGDIEVSSEMGKGTTFTMALPIEQPRDN